MDAEDRRKHLEMIQAAVTRMASSSASAKSWLLPVATVAYGYAITDRNVPVALLGLGAVILFGFLDAQYLRLERAFRVLYKKAAFGAVTVFDMNPSPYFNRPNGDEDDQRSENCRWSSVVWSWSLAGFYAPLVLAGGLILWVLLSSEGIANC